MHFLNSKLWGNKSPVRIYTPVLSSLSFYAHSELRYIINGRTIYQASKPKNSLETQGTGVRGSGWRSEGVLCLPFQPSPFCDDHLLSPGSRPPRGGGGTHHSHRKFESHRSAKSECAFARHARPKRVVRVGGGWSWLAPLFTHHRQKKN